jgi:hypothetical protein
VNLLHLTDAIGVLSTIIRNNIWGYTLNVCALSHPPRREFYPAAATFLGLTPPTFRPEYEPGKTIDSSLLRSVVTYTFQYDDVLAAIAACPASSSEAATRA